MVVVTVVVMVIVTVVIMIIVAVITMVMVVMSSAHLQSDHVECLLVMRMVGFEL